MLATAEGREPSPWYPGGVPYLGWLVASRALALDSGQQAHHVPEIRRP